MFFLSLIPSDFFLHFFYTSILFSGVFLWDFYVGKLWFFAWISIFVLSLCLFFSWKFVCFILFQFACAFLFYYYFPIPVPILMRKGNQWCRFGLDGELGRIWEELGKGNQIENILSEKTCFQFFKKIYFIFNNIHVCVYLQGSVLLCWAYKVLLATYVCAGNQVHPLCKSNMHFQLPNHLSRFYSSTFKICSKNIYLN